jgi:hypothetical protein
MVTRPARHLPPSPAAVRRLRNQALIALAANDNLAPTVLDRLRGDSVRLRAGEHSLRLLVRRPGADLVVYLDTAQEAALRAYLDAAGIWGTSTPLFEGLALAGIKQVLWRSRRGG